MQALENKGTVQQQYSLKEIEYYVAVFLTDIPYSGKLSREKTFADW